MSLYANDVMLYWIIRLQVDFLALQIDIDMQFMWVDWWKLLDFQCSEVKVHGDLKKTGANPALKICL